jgi:hypothetical protein
VEKGANPVAARFSGGNTVNIELGGTDDTADNSYLISKDALDNE